MPMDPTIQEQLAAKAGDAAKLSLEDAGPLPFTGEVLVWHPLDDIYAAPRMTLPQCTRVHVARRGEETIAYVFDKAAGNMIIEWRPIGDAGTDTDRLFLVPARATDHVVDWMNEDVSGFENLGGERDVETVTHDGTGASVVVFLSGDGNADIHGGYDAEGKLAAALIFV